MKNIHIATLKCTLRCLLGCNIGEFAGMIIGMVLGLDIISTIIIAISLAFFTGYALTVLGLLKTMSLKRAINITIRGETASISSMEFAENTLAFFIPNFINASLMSAIFWIGFAVILPIGFIASYPIMYYIMKRENQKCCNS